MPLIVMCGGPCSGKTTFATKIQKYFEDKKFVVNLINEESLKVQKMECYKDSTQEKLHRTHIKSEVEKNISDKTITIVDTLNYIKGTRYELYCLVRNCKTRHCVIYGKASLDKCLENNDKSKEYDVFLLKDLYSRMEEPIQSNRWDCPMYTLYPDDSIPFDDINISLFEGKKPRDPVSTKPDLTFDTNFLSQLDKNCQDVVNDILSQQDFALGDTIMKCKNEKGEEVAIYLKKKFTAIQLKKIKSEFIKISKAHPPKDKDETMKNFVEYIVTVQDRY